MSPRPSIETAYNFITDICSQSLTTVALDEIQRFPDMLLWLKHGHEFHEANGIEDCLLCGNPISSERRTLLASAFDSQVDTFVAKLAKTADRLTNALTTLTRLEETIPTTDALVTELRADFGRTRAETVGAVKQARSYLRALQSVLTRKQDRPATRADMSGLASQSNIAATVTALAQAIEGTNRAIAAHNDATGNFTKHKEAAELAIREHFIADCRTDYGNYTKELDDAQTKLTAEGEELKRLNDLALQLRQQIKEHGPAAGAINKLIASYLGHGELTIHPIEQGYELYRHGERIRGAPSEGEKTAIAISYFLSSIEAEGRKLKDLIVVIDDPVSSLDTKALNYACSLVRSRLGECAQLFVLTHNLQCMNEFRKAWKSRARPPEGKEATAALLFIDVSMPIGKNKRSSTIVEMPRLLREYDSEYHFLFGHVLKFTADPETYYEHGYMMPNVLRRVLDVFLAFKCPGSSGLTGQIAKLCADFPNLDRDRLSALERLSQVESHSDNLDDLLSFSSMTLEETRAAAGALLEMIDVVDSRHLAGLRHLCR